jgi:hypothetical protein
MMARRLALPVLLLSLALPAAADSLLTMKSHHDAFVVNGQKQDATDTTIKIWLAGDRMRRDEEDQSLILRLDRNRLYVVDHESKTYSEVPVPVDLRAMMPKGNEALADKVAAMMRLTVQLTPSDETKKIKDWTAHRYDASIESAMGMKIQTTLWVSKDVPGYATLDKMLATKESLQPGAAAWVGELQKMDGFPVLQESTVDAVGAKFKTRDELIAVDDRPAPAGTFDPPTGYTLRPYQPIAGFSR